MVIASQTLFHYSMVPIIVHIGALIAMVCSTYPSKVITYPSKLTTLAWIGNYFAWIGRQ